MAAFGCNFSGAVTPEQVFTAIADGMSVSAEAGVAITRLSLTDTTGWANPAQVEWLVGEVHSH
ncbi:hypothetical protein VQH23_07930 [Pararoseomonas sp. SCSIO 73927]|uniref:hypothetical protein n=1 Tax=Pararoseomonas sp. SCSIO 73927 TaxID=3114537 RepID=UPI0030D41107